MHTNGTIVVFGGSGAIGKSVLDLLLLRDARPLVATHRSQAPPELPGVVWVRFDAATGEGGSDLAKVIARNGACVRSVVFAIGCPSSKRKVVETPVSEWIETFAVNAIGLVNAYTAVHEPARRGQARVVVLSSDTTRKVGASNGPYTVAKASLEAIALTLAKEEAPQGVRVNVLAPSLVDSPLANRVLRLKGVNEAQSYALTQPWGRLLTSREVAEAALSMVLDPAWAYATGQVYRLASSA